MDDVTRVLGEIERGIPGSTERLLPLVYEELRSLAASQMRRERPGQTLQPTALVHEAFLRLVDVEKAQRWNSVGHFFAAAALAMRRILVENARRKSRLKHGGGRSRIEIEITDLPTRMTSDDLLALDEALDVLAKESPVKAHLVTLRYFGGMTVDRSAELLGISRVTAHRYWTHARAWLFQRLRAGESGA